MEKVLRKGGFWGGRLILSVIFLTGLLYSTASAVGMVDVQVNQTVTAQTSSSPVDEASCPKKLWQAYGKGYGGKFHVQVYRFTVKPGEKYTFYGYFPADGIYRNAYLRGDNPLTDYTSSYGDTQGVTTGFVFWFQQPGKWQCPAVTRRVNITISPKSSSNYLYVIATSMAPRLSFQIMLKSPADPDTDVEKNTVDPSCPPKKGYTWGQVWGSPILLRYDPSEQARPAVTPAVPDPHKPLGVTDLPLNQRVTVQTSPAPLDQSQSPKKLWQRYGKGYAPKFYTRIYRFTVNAGEKYTLYGFFPPDGVYRNFYILGDNPLTDTTWAFGNTQGVSIGFVFWFQQPGKWQCSFVSRRVNISISPRSEHRYLYLVATSMAPTESFQVMLKSPADPDFDVDKNVQDPSCPPKKGYTWGQVWGDPILLRNDPGEQGKTTAVVPPPTQPTGVEPQKPPQTGTPPSASTPYGQTLPPVPQGTYQWIEYIKSGRAFWVHFDMTMSKFNDSNFTGDWRTDPMGTLQGGQVYEVAFGDGKFACTGYHQAGRRVETHAFGGINPEDGLISLWGRTYAFDGKGQVWDQDYGLVGHLHLFR